MPAEAESPALVRMDEEVEKGLLVRFAPFTALRDVDGDDYAVGVFQALNFQKRHVSEA